MGEWGKGKENIKISNSNFSQAFGVVQTVQRGGFGQRQLGIIGEQVVDLESASAVASEGKSRQPKR
jgi:hypothetical protein